MTEPQEKNKDEYKLKEFLQKVETLMIQNLNDNRKSKAFNGALIDCSCLRCNILKLLSNFFKEYYSFFCIEYSRIIVVLRFIGVL